VAYHYSRPSREKVPNALPDIECFVSSVLVCVECGAESPTPAVSGTLPQETLCLNPPCLGVLTPKTPPEKKWWWWSCFPGCLPDGDPSGPFDTEDEALDDAREGIEDEEEPRSWKVEVIADSSGKWSSNALRFKTKPEAETYAKDLASRWTSVTVWRVVESDEEPNR
jgi:hypothetical protein